MPSATPSPGSWSATNRECYQTEKLFKLSLKSNCYLAKYDEFKLDLWDMEHARSSLFESLPWPTFARPSFDNLPAIVPVHFKRKCNKRKSKRYSYIAFDAEDPSHPFSNDFVAPFPMKDSLLVHTVQNLTMAVCAIVRDIDVDRQIKILCAETLFKAELIFANSIPRSARPRRVCTCGCELNANDFVECLPQYKNAGSSTHECTFKPTNGSCMCDRLVQMQSFGVFKKFLHHRQLRELLLSTGESEIIAFGTDASHRESETCGLPMSSCNSSFDPFADRPWENRLGCSLMAARTLLRKFKSDEIDELVKKCQIANIEKRKKGTRNVKNHRAK